MTRAELLDALDALLAEPRAAAIERERTAFDQAAGPSAKPMDN